MIVAGSIASIDRALAVGEAGAWGYTIGSAIFDGLLPGAPSIADQVRRVLEATAERRCIPRNPDVGLAECPAELCSPTGLRDELLEEITSSQLQPGTKLPSEGQLAKRFNVSRATVRDAVRGLVEAGYVTRRRGSGSYVTERRRMPHGLDSTLSYLAMIESAGARAGMRILEAAFEPCCQDDAPLQLDPGDTVLAVERVRTADDRPVIYSLDRIPRACSAPTSICRTWTLRCSRY